MRATPNARARGRTSLRAHARAERNWKNKTEHTHAHRQNTQTVVVAVLFEHSNDVFAHGVPVDARVVGVRDATLVLGEHKRQDGGGKSGIGPIGIGKRHAATALLLLLLLLLLQGWARCRRRRAKIAARLQSACRTQRGDNSTCSCAEPTFASDALRLAQQTTKQQKASELSYRGAQTKRLCEKANEKQSSWFCLCGVCVDFSL